MMHIECQCEKCQKDRLELSEDRKELEALRMAKALMSIAEKFKFEETVKQFQSKTDKVQ